MPFSLLDHTKTDCLDACAANCSCHVLAPAPAEFRACPAIRKPCESRWASQLRASNKSKALRIPEEVHQSTDWFEVALHALFCWR